jgi:hypothetical protein
LPAQKRPFSVRRAVVLLLWYGKQEARSSQGTQTWKGDCADANFCVLWPVDFLPGIRKREPPCLPPWQHGLF